MAIKTEHDLQEVIGMRVFDWNISNDSSLLEGLFGGYCISPSLPQYGRSAFQDLKDFFNWLNDGYSISGGDILSLMAA